MVLDGLQGVTVLLFLSGFVQIDFLKNVVNIALFVL